MLRLLLTTVATTLLALSLAAFAGSAAYPLDLLTSFRFHSCSWRDCSPRSPSSLARGAPFAHVRALHTPSPITPRPRARAGPGAPRGWKVGRAGGRGAVVLGDLNATPWSHGFRDLKQTGRLHSSLDGRGLQATWPSALGRLGVPIDHLLYSTGLTVVARSPGPSFGSGHRSLWVTLARA